MLQMPCRHQAGRMVVIGHAHHPRRQLRLPEHHGGRLTCVQDFGEAAGKRRRQHHHRVMCLHGQRQDLPPVHAPFLSPLGTVMHRLKRAPLTTRLVEQGLIRRVVVGTAPVRAEYQHVEHRVAVAAATGCHEPLFSGRSGDQPSRPQGPQRVDDRPLRHLKPLHERQHRHDWRAGSQLANVAFEQLGHAEMLRGNVTKG